MTYYAFIQNGEIINTGQCKCLNADILNIEVSEEIYNNIEKYTYKDGEIVLNENYEQEQQEKEKARIQELSMTRSDFFDGTIMAWGIGQDELLVLIQNLLETLPIEVVKKMIAINNFRNALNFYRKHDLFKMIVAMPIKLTETMQVVVTEESLDNFFNEVDKGNKEIAWQYLPQPTAIPIEPVEEEVEE